MSVCKEWIGKTLVLILDGIYSFDDYHYVWDIAMRNAPEISEVFSADHIIIDCTNLKGIEETGGEIFFLQLKFEKGKSGKFLYCGLDADLEKLFNFLAKDMTESKDIKIQNFPTRQEAVDFILMGN